MQETWVPFLGWEDPLEKEMVTHYNISSLGNPMDRGTWWATVHGVSRVGHDCPQVQAVIATEREGPKGFTV